MTDGDGTGGFATRALRPLGEVWQFRLLLRRLAVRNLKVKYQRSLLGFAWTLLNPLLTIAVLIVVFRFVVRIPVPSYWAFLLSGYFVWNFTMQMLTSGTHILGEHAGLRRSVAFPSEVLVLGVTASRMVEFLIELTIALGLLILAHHRGVPPSFALLPVLLLLQLTLMLGLLFPLSALALFYNDLQHSMPVVTLILFYVSPVFYPATLVPESMRSLFMANPLAGLLTLFHVVLYEGRFPSAGLLLEVAAASLVIGTLGYAVFRRYRSVLAELV